MHLLHPLLHLGLLLLFLRMKPSECLVTNQWLHLTGQNERRDTLDGGWDAFAGSRIDGNTVHRRRDGQVLQFLKKLTAMAAAIAVEEHYGLRHMEIGEVRYDWKTRRFGSCICVYESNTCDGAGFGVLCWDCRRSINGKLCGRGQPSDRITPYDIIIDSYTF